MAITWAQVVLAYPNDATLAAVDADAEGATYVAWAEQRARADVNGVLIDQIHINLAAHLAAAVGGGSGGAGPITSESVDGVSRSYGAPPSWLADTDLGDTVYGKRAAVLMRASVKARLPRIA